MPRHLTSDAHEWINEVPSVPIYYLAKPRPRERSIFKARHGGQVVSSLAACVRGSEIETASPPCPAYQSAPYSCGINLQAFACVHCMTGGKLYSRLRQCLVGLKQLIFLELTSWSTAVDLQSTS